MAEEKWEKYKMKEVYQFVSIDEIVVVATGLVIFSLQSLVLYRLYYIVFIIVWYWFKIRKVETEIHKKKQEILAL